MNWRAKFFIQTEAFLENGNIHFKEAVINIYDAPPDYFNNIPNYKLIEILFAFSLEGEIQGAYVRSFDLIEELVDRICVIGYCQVHIIGLISICKEEVRPEEEFPIIQMNYAKERWVNNIKPQQLVFDTSEQNEKYLRLLRDALNTISLEEKLLRYFSLIEQIAQNESVETVKRPCPECGHEVDTGMKKTNVFIKDVLTKYGLTSKEVNEITGYRGKIAHGGGRRDQKYFFDIDIFSTKIETPAFREVLERIKVEVNNGENIHAPGIPICNTVYKFNNMGQLILVSWEWKSNMQYSCIDDTKKNAFKLGIPLDENNKPLAPEKIALPVLRLV